MNARADDVTEVRDAGLPVRGRPEDWDPLLELIGDAPIVLLGEATHGTHEFYTARAAITRRLIEEKGFSALAVEADWPDAYRVNRFVRHLGRDASPRDALSDFQRFPRWMWRNDDVLDFITWLRDHNASLPAADQAGFYGLDLYSLYASIHAVLQYLDRTDPPAARRARARYECFDHSETPDPQHYGLEVSIGVREPCENEAVEQLRDLQHRASETLEADGLAAADEQFHAEMNARVVETAAEYYRAMFSGRINTWNLRDQHMADAADALLDHLSTTDRPAKLVIWAHNSHIGDARATDMSRRGELNVGEILRIRHGADTVLVGFTTYDGTVAAADDWDGPVHRKTVRPALPGSYEALFHRTGLGDFLLPLRGHAVAGALARERLQRMIGVIYRPETERVSHYFECRIDRQFDAVIHYDHTRALDPLEGATAWRTRQKQQTPQTYPHGL